MDKVQKTDQEWRKALAPNVYRVTRQKGTERPFTGALLDNKLEGIYRCGACGHPLFSSETKFNSGSGWPSYWAPIDEHAVEQETDQSHSMVRNEVVCSRCDSHLGHVFPDGPQPSGLRYCINSLSLEFEPSEPADK